MKKMIPYSVYLPAEYHDKIKDLARNTIVFTTQGDVDSAVKSLLKKYPHAKMKQFTPENNDLGYTGYNIVIPTKSGVAAEVQVNTAAMLLAKEGEAFAPLVGEKLYRQVVTTPGIPPLGMGHKLYEEWRGLDDPESPKAKKIASVSRRYYSTVRDLFLGRQK